MDADAISNTSRNDETRKRILELAKTRFLTQRYSKVSVDDLSKTLRISKKTLYQHFSSKEVLLAEAVTQHLGDFDVSIRQIVEGDGNFVDKLEHLLRLIHERFGWLEPHALEDIQVQVPHVWQHIMTFRTKTLTENLVTLLEEGKQEGTLRGDLEASLVVEMMLASLRTLTRPQTLAARDRSASQMVTLVVRTMIEGCRKDSDEQ